MNYQEEDFYSQPQNGGNNRKGHIPEEESEKDYHLEKIRKNKKSKTPTIDHFGRDLTKLAHDEKLDPVIGREREARQMIQILNKRKKNNPILVGEAGTGKTAIVEKLAQKIAEGDIDENFLDKRIVELNLTSLVSGTKYRGMFEERMEVIIKEATENENIILFMDEIHVAIGAGGATGSMDASNILKPALARGEIKLIGATTFEEYQQHIEKDKAFNRRFQKITVGLQSREEIIKILQNIKEKYEEHHLVKYSDEILEKIVDITERYVIDRNNPDKSIDLLDEVGSKIYLTNQPEVPEDIVNLREQFEESEQEMLKAKHDQRYEDANYYKEEKNNLKLKLEEREEEFKEYLKNLDFAKITFDDIASIISDYTGIPVNTLTESDVDKIANMASKLKERVIAQDEAVDKVTQAIQRSRTKMGDPNKPNSFLFLGPTGVGKNEVVRRLAEYVFDSEENIIKEDMSEYSEKFQVSKMFGAPPGYIGHEEGGKLTEKVRQNPYSIILFDEFEKAHPDLKNNLLQILDEGFINDAKGRKVDFRNTIIIMTSNIGTSKIIEEKKVGFKKPNQEEIDIEHEVREELKKHSITSPEFLNRIDDVIIFKPLSKNAIRRIVDVQLGYTLDRVKKENDISVKVDKKVKDFLSEEGYDEEYGARPLKRAITDHVENILSQSIVDGKIKEGDSVSLKLDRDDNVYVEKKK